MGKMDKKWVVICSTAIASVYGAGLLSTQLQANAVQTKILPQAVQSTSNAGTQAMKRWDGSPASSCAS